LDKGCKGEIRKLEIATIDKCHGSGEVEWDFIVFELFSDVVPARNVVVCCSLNDVDGCFIEFFSDVESVVARVDRVGSGNRGCNGGSGSGSGSGSGRRCRSSSGDVSGGNYTCIDTKSRNDKCRDNGLVDVLVDVHDCRCCCC